ncbi:MAG: glycosyltransferase [Selenomonadales bacterium]|nr:glycosyltransferase [Selenomonadales bacterium]
MRDSKAGVKVALFLPTLGGGGAERVMVNLAQAFAERGLSVDLVVAKAEGPLLASVPPEVRLINLNGKRVLTSLPALVGYLRREQPRALLSALDYANVVTLCARRLASKQGRIVVSEHNTLSMNASRSNTASGRVMPWLARALYPMADAIVAVSHGVAVDLAKVTGLPRERITVIYNPVVSPKVLRLANELNPHPWLAPGELPVILGVGRLTAAKDFPTLLRAFALVRPTCSARLVVLGEGDERARLAALASELGIQDYVSMPGYVDNPYAYMARASLFVLSSMWEGLPTVLVETMALGTPVIATDCPSGPAEILEDGKWGQLVPVGDHKALADAITNELICPQERLGLAERAQVFEVNAVAEKYLEILLQ